MLGGIQMEDMFRPMLDLLTLTLKSSRQVQSERFLQLRRSISVV